MSLHNIRIEGVLTTTSPLHITDAASARFDPTSNKPRYHTDTGGLPLTKTRSLDIMLPSTVKEGENEGLVVRRKTMVPVLPSQGLRGALRRSCARIIEDHFMLNLGQQISFQAYNGMHSGAISGQLDKSLATTDEIVRVRKHLFMGLFGGGPRMMRGNLKTSFGTPITTKTIDAGLVPDSVADYQVDAEPYQLLGYMPVFRSDDTLKSHDPVAEQVVMNFVEAKEEAIKAVMLNRAAKASGEEGGERGISTMSYMEYIVPGTSFFVRHTISGTRAQAGFLIEGIRRLAETQTEKGIGGKTAAGFGQYQLSFDLIIDGVRHREALKFGADDMFVLSSEAQALIDEMQTELEVITPMEMHNFMAFTETPESAEDGKKAKKTKGDTNAE